MLHLAKVESAAMPTHDRPPVAFTDLPMSISNKAAPMGGLDECWDIPHLCNSTLHGPNLHFPGCVPEGTLVSQTGQGSPASSLTEYQHHAKLSGLENTNNTEDTWKVYKKKAKNHLGISASLASLESISIHSLMLLTA